MNNTLGRHILCEVYGCDPGVLDDVKTIEGIMVNAALQAGAEIREVAFHKFNPQGVSGIVVISESHLSIHTWPEYGYAAVDVFTCGEKVNPIAACNYISQGLKARKVAASEIKRGILEKHCLERISLIKFRVELKTYNEA